MIKKDPLFTHQTVFKKVVLYTLAQKAWRTYQNDCQSIYEDSNGSEVFRFPQGGASNSTERLINIDLPYSKV